MYMYSVQDGMEAEKREREREREREPSKRLCKTNKHDNTEDAP